MVGLAILSGLRRGELFALRWHDIDEHARVLTVREAVYDGIFATPKTEAGRRQIPLSDLALRDINEWKQQAGVTEPDKLVFSLANLPAQLFIVVTRQGSAWQGSRATHGSRQRGHYA